MISFLTEKMLINCFVLSVGRQFMIYFSNTTALKSSAGMYYPVFHIESDKELAECDIKLY